MSLMILVLNFNVYFFLLYPTDDDDEVSINLCIRRTVDNDDDDPGLCAVTQEEHSIPVVDQVY